jgi:hypothetical protein
MWCYYIDHFGDAESGDVVYSAGGDTKKAPYDIATVAGKASCTIHTERAIDVVPRTVYEEEAEDGDHYAAMESERLYRAEGLPLYERFISKDERKSAGRDSFAGRGRSFPILKPSDVMAAVKAMGRAGADNYDAGTLKRNIIKIAKAKGWGKELPKAWQGDGEESKESGVPTGGALKLIESTAFSQDIPLREAFKEGYRIKLIAPGKGSSAYYTEEMLRRDGPNVFKAGTPMRIDHPTEAEERERPEGSVKNWGAVLAKDAYWMDNGPAGKGLYSEVKPFSDHVQTIHEKGPHAGVSICAWGDPLTENGKVVMREGVPVLATLNRADGVDMVTRAGAGGMFLSESARSAESQHEEVSDVDATELTALKESLAAREANEKKLLERAIRGDARELCVRALKGITLHEAGKELVTESIMSRPLPVTDGMLDETKLTEAINAEAKRVGAVIAAAAGSGMVRGMGAAAPAPVDAKEAEQQKAASERRLQESIRAFRDMGMPEEAAKRAASRGMEAA